MQSQASQRMAAKLSRDDVLRVYAMRRSIDQLFPDEGMTYAAPYVAFRVALQHGLITQTEHNEAEAVYGQLWDYSGD